jgi:CheY-like chemotaxis protein
MKIPSQFVVVDDDPINNMICKYIIEKFVPHPGIELFTDPEKGIDWIRNRENRKPGNLSTVVFLDINMPGMSGWEFLEEFKLFVNDLDEQINIIILSSSIDPEDRESAESHPLVHGYYSKPLSLETLDLIFNQ